MKIVHFADLHLDAQFAWAGREHAGTRRQALRDTLLRITELAVSERADALFCGGDLYEQERFTPDTAQFVREAFAAIAPIRVLLAPGNHDWYGPASLYREVGWTSNVHVFSGDRLSPVALADGLTVWGAAHLAPANTDNFLNTFHVNRGGVHIALFHGSEQSSLRFERKGKVPHAPFHEDEIALAGLDHAFLGHFHTPADRPEYTYPGNPDPLTFGEDGERGTVIALIAPDGSVQRERRSVASSNVNDITVDLTGCESKQGIRDRVRDAVAGYDGFVRVTLTGELHPDAEIAIEDLRGIAPHVAGLVARFYDVRAAYDLEAIAQEQTVRGQFVREVRASNLEAVEKQRVLITGLRALAGRQDLEAP